MKKKFGILLGCIALIFVFAACGQGGGADAGAGAVPAAGAGAASAPAAVDADGNFNPTGWPVVNEPITISAVVRDDPNFTMHYNELALNRLWAEETNVHVDWIKFDVGAWEERVNLLLISGDLPDVLFGPISMHTELTYADQGFWQPLQDLIHDYTTYIREFSEMYPEVFSGWFAPSGNIYSLARVKYEEDMKWINRMFINQVWLNNLGLDKPTNLDEFTYVLRAFRDRDPNGDGGQNIVPLAFRYALTNTDRRQGNHRHNLFGFMGMFGRVGSIDHIVIENGEVVFSANQPEYKAFVSWMHMAHEEGLIDPEAFTMDIASYRARNITGDHPVYGVWNGWTIVEATNPPEEGIEIYSLLPPMHNVNNQRVWPRFDYNVSTSGWMFITRENQFPRETIRWIDFISEPYMSIQHDWGMEGIGSRRHPDGTWEVLGDGLVTSRTAEGMAWLLPTIVPLHLYDIAIYASPVQYFQAIQNTQVLMPHGVQLFPNAYFTLEEAQDMIQLSSDIGGHIARTTARWITQGGVEDEWDEYLATLESLGLARYIEIYRNTYARYLETLAALLQ